MARWHMEDRRFAGRAGEGSMPGQLLRTGSAVLRQKRGAGTNILDAAKRLAAEALEDCQPTELPVRYRAAIWIWKRRVWRSGASWRL